jgi:hypothetical protein
MLKKVLDWVVMASVLLWFAIFATWLFISIGSWLRPRLGL